MIFWIVSHIAQINTCEIPGTLLKTKLLLSVFAGFANDQHKARSGHFGPFFCSLKKDEVLMRELDLAQENPEENVLKKIKKRK